MVTYISSRRRHTWPGVLSEECQPVKNIIDRTCAKTLGARWSAEGPCDELLLQQVHAKLAKQFQWAENHLNHGTRIFYEACFVAWGFPSHKGSILLKPSLLKSDDFHVRLVSPSHNSWLPCSPNECGDRLSKWCSRRNLYLIFRSFYSSWLWVKGVPPEQVLV